MAEEESESTQIQRNQKRGRRLKPRSKVWEQFTRHTGDDGNETATCNRCGKEYAYHGTKNLWEHYYEGCGGQESADAGAAEQPPQALPSLAQDEAMQQLPPLPPPPPCAPSRHGGSWDRGSSGLKLKEEASKHLARMIALRGYDASVLEDDCFRSFVRSLNPEFEVPSRVAIENMCDGIFDEARRDLLERLRRAPGKVSVAVGRAKTMEEEVLYVACHFIDDGWNLHKLLLHAIVTTDHHDDYDGPILGLDIYNDEDEIPNGFFEVTSNHGISDSLLMVAYETTDKDIHPALMDYFNEFGTSWVQIRFMDNVLHSIARCLIPNQKFNRALFQDMMDLKLTRQERLELLAELDLHYGWAYDEHWYACYCSLQVLYKEGFPYEPEDEEFDTEKLLHKLWEKIYRAIQKISSPTRPTANLCLTELFKMRGVLQHELARFSSGDHGGVDDLFDDDKDVTYVLKNAIDILDKAIHDSYLAWSLPLALDPRYKLEYLAFNFKRAYSSEAAEEYVSNVTTRITDLYDDYDEDYGTADGASSSIDTATSADDPLEQAWNEHCRSQQGMETQVSSFNHPEAETELDRYLRDPLAPQAEGFDILSWWKAHSSEYPTVARMARDALAMPTCSKLSSDQMAQVRGILRGYSKKPYGPEPE